MVHFNSAAKTHFFDMKQKIVALTGAGISAESGIKTFRDSDGLWEGYDVMAVASPEGWRKNPALVLDFYNKRRQQLLTVSPNPAHEILAALEEDYAITIITQNVDDLHERAGSTTVLHLHGQLLESRSSKNEHLIYDCQSDIKIGDFCNENSQLRPNIVWFGEDVPAITEAAQIVAKADIFLIIGTSLQVYPAAGLIDYAPDTTPIYYIDTNPAPIPTIQNTCTVITAKASEGLATFKKIIETATR